MQHRSGSRFNHKSNLPREGISIKFLNDHQFGVDAATLWPYRHAYKSTQMIILLSNELNWIFLIQSWMYWSERTWNIDLICPVLWFGCTMHTCVLNTRRWSLIYLSKAFLFPQRHAVRTMQCGNRGVLVHPETKRICKPLNDLFSVSFYFCVSSWLLSFISLCSFYHRIALHFLSIECLLLPVMLIVTWALFISSLFYSNLSPALFITALLQLQLQTSRWHFLTYPNSKYKILDLSVFSLINF